MASRVITQLLSDLSGDEIAEGQGETIEFAYRGRSYSIDLTSQEAEKFDRAIAKYIAAGRPAGAAMRPGGKPRRGGDAKEVRAWAKAQGLDIPARGRIPSAIRDQYHASV